MTVAGMPAEEFIRKVVERDPATAVLATSGYPISLETLSLPKGTRVAMLEKPFMPRTLKKTLERLLGGEPGAAG